MNKKCTNPELGRLLARYEFGKVTKEEKKEFEQHLLECEVCFQDYYSFSPITETIKNNIKDFRKAVKKPTHTISHLLMNIKNIITNFNTFSRPWRIAVPGIAVIIIIIFSYILISSKQYNQIRLFVQKDSDTFMVHPPENIDSKAFGDSIAVSRTHNRQTEDFTELFTQKMFIKKNIESRALEFRWPRVSNLDHYRNYLSLVKNNKMITPVKTFQDTLFMYPIENIPPKQFIFWNLSVHLNNGKVFSFSKKFKINY